MAQDWKQTSAMTRSLPSIVTGTWYCLHSQAGLTSIVIEMRPSHRLFASSAICRWTGSCFEASAAGDTKGAAARTSAETMPLGAAFLAGLFERVDLRAIVGAGVVVVVVCAGSAGER